MVSLIAGALARNVESGGPNDGTKVDESVKEKKPDYGPDYGRKVFVKKSEKTVNMEIEPGAKSLGETRRK